MSDSIILMRGIRKHFINNIPVLKDVDFELRYGEVHSLFGENGAGKSVLIKILSGIIQPDAGEIYVAGERVQINNPADALLLGIRAVQQEQNLQPDLSVAENIFISRVKSFTNRLGMIKRGKMYEECSSILKSLDFGINPGRMLKDLSAGERQLVEIAKALVHNGRVVILDEPTNSLTDVEIEKLYAIINNLKKKGISIIYISHRIEEVVRISDRITILRDGEVIKTDTAGNISKDLLIKLSAGKSYKERYPKLPVVKGRTLFKAVKLSTDKRISDISF